MNQEPNRSEVEALSRKIESLFVIPHDEAMEQASGLLHLACGWGDGTVTGVWDHAIKKKLDKSYEWKSEETKKEFEKEEKLTVEGYNRYIDNHKRNKWIV